MLAKAVSVGTMAVADSIPETVQGASSASALCLVPLPDLGKPNYNKVGCLMGIDAFPELDITPEPKPKQLLPVTPEKIEFSDAYSGESGYQDQRCP